ncbi:MAG: alpha/beta hydrolase [Flavobacteriaceae bacterium]
MNSTEKEVAYTIQNSYSTLNSLTPNTKNVWIVCHGLGFLSRYFIQYFNELNSEENYIIAPQAQSKHYLKNQFKHVGACWLTKENTQNEIPNVLNYLEAVYKQEKLDELNLNVIVLGFSQGVSIATRWVAQRQIKCDSLVLYAGKIPREFSSSDFNTVKYTKLIVGNSDNYVTPEVLHEELTYAKQLFGDKLSHITFKGGHEVQRKLINALV